MTTRIASIFVAALVVACASNEKLFSVRGELAWAEMPPIIVECKTGAIYDIVMSSDLYGDFAPRADELASTSSSPIMVQLRGTVTLDLTAAMLRRSLGTRFKMVVRHIDLIEHGACE
jgi:hypothetical protein